VARKVGVLRLQLISKFLLEGVARQSVVDVKVSTQRGSRYLITRGKKEIL